MHAVVPTGSLTQRKRKSFKNAGQRAVAAWLFYLRLVNGVGDLVGKDAGGQAGDNPGHTHFMCCKQHIVIDGEIVSLEEMKPSIQNNLTFFPAFVKTTVCACMLTHTKKSRFCLMFMKSPPTIAAR